MKKYLLLLILLPLTNIHAQTYDKIYDAGSIYATMVSSDSNIYATGPGPSSNRWSVIKQSLSGQLLWQQNFIIPGFNIKPSKIKETTDGNIVILCPVDTANFLLVKLDTSGTILFVKHYADNVYNGYVSEMEIDAEGNLYLLSEYGFTLHKIDSTGSVVWAKKFTNNMSYWMPEDACGSMILSNGHLLVQGISHKDNGIGGWYNCLSLHTIDTSGTILTTKIFSDTVNCQYCGLAVGAAIPVNNGRIIYSANFNISQETQIIMNMDTTGLISWTKWFRCFNYVWDVRTLVFHNSAIYLFYIPDLAYDMGLTKFDMSGNLLWNKGYQNSGWGGDNISNMVVTPDNKIILSGQKHFVQDKAFIDKIDTGFNFCYTYPFNSSTVLNVMHPALDATNTYSVTSFSVTSTTLTSTDSSSSYQLTPCSVQACSVSGNILSNVSCYGNCNGSAAVTSATGTPPYTYLWNPSGQTGQTATVLCAGTYTCMVTDSTGCTASDTVVVTEPAPVMAGVCSQTDVSCYGFSNGWAAVCVSGGTGGYTYLWTPSSVTTATATNLSANCYTVTVTDANGCSDTSTVCITQPPPPFTYSGQSNVLCYGDSTGSAYIYYSTGHPPYTYSWSPTGGNAATATNLPIGTYTVTATDGNGCSVIANIAITQPPQLTATVCGLTNVSCNGWNDACASVCPAGGTPPYSYTWSTIPPTYSQTPCGLFPVSYTVTVTDANGCSTLLGVIITEPPALAVTLTVTDASCSSCCDGIIESTTTGGIPPYTYDWSPSASNSPTASFLCPGEWSLTVTDANGCIAVSSDTVSYPTNIETQLSIVNSQFSIYPNPAQNSFTVSLINTVSITPFQVSVFGLIGNLVEERSITAGSAAFDVSHYANGVYQIRVTAGSKIFTAKIVVMKD